MPRCCSFWGTKEKNSVEAGNSFQFDTRVPRNFASLGIWSHSVFILLDFCLFMIPNKLFSISVYLEIPE